MDGRRLERSYKALVVNGCLDLREALEWAARNKALLRVKWMELSGS